MKRRMVGGQIEVSRGGQFREDSPRISSFLFCLQDENGKFALYHIKRKMLTGFEFDRYSVDGDIVSLEKDGRIVYYSTQGFRQNF